MQVEPSRQDATHNHHWALVLAGGDGMRLQELTRLIAGRPIPKQYCRIVDGQSLLEATLTRIAPVFPANRTLAIINRPHLHLARAQLRSIPPGNVLIQPQNRDTGPGMLLSLLALQRRDPQARVAVFPSDHYIGNDAAFRQSVEHARELVERRPQAIVLVGIAPDRPDAGFGYIEPGARLALRGVGSAYTVARFREKPEEATARSLMACGGLWNSFIMMARVERMLELLADVRSADLLAMRNLHSPAAVSAAYERLTAWNFSSGFLARIPEQLTVLRASGLDWNDWGTPEAIERTLKQLNRVPPWELSLPQVVAPQSIAR